MAVNRRLALWTVLLLAAWTIYNLSVPIESAIQSIELPKRARLVIHVGPPKTSSTTIQFDLMEREDILLRDNYLNLGKWSNDTHDRVSFLLRDCPPKVDKAIQAGLQAEDVECYQAFLNNLEKHTGRSIIISEELFNRAAWSNHLPIMREHFLDVIEQHRDILVVAVYRRYAEWLLSAKKQRDANQCLGDYNKGWRRRWPQKGGRACEANWPAIVNNTEQFTQLQSAFRYESPHDALQIWKELDVRTVMINMHEPRPVTERLICDVLRDLPLTCASLMAQSKTKHANQRTTSRFDYDWIVVQASKRGLVNIGTPRMLVVDDLIKYHEGINRTVHDLPMTCPSREEVQKLLNVSLAVEQELMPQIAPDDVFAHVQDFGRCTIEVTFVLRMTPSCCKTQPRGRRSFRIWHSPMPTH